MIVAVAAARGLWSRTKRRTLGRPGGAAVTAEDPKVMGWGMIVVIVAATGIVVGLLLGIIGQGLAVPPGRMTAGVGAAMGVVGALLVTRRRAALAQQVTRRG